MKTMEQAIKSLVKLAKEWSNFSEKFNGRIDWSWKNENGLFCWCYFSENEQKAVYFGFDKIEAVVISLSEYPTIQFLTTNTAESLFKVVEKYRAFLKAEKAKIKPLDIDKMGEEMRERDRNEIPVKSKGYRGAGEHKFEGDK